MTVQTLIGVLLKMNPNDTVQILTSRYNGGGDEWANAGDTPVVLSTRHGGAYLTPDFEEDVALYQLRDSGAFKVE